MRRLVSIALFGLIGAGAPCIAGARPTNRLQDLVDQLAAPTRAARWEARRVLMAEGDQARDRIAACTVPAGDEARRAFAYVLEHLPRLPRSIEIPAGEYRVGSEAVIDQNPRRSVRLAAFRMDECEVSCFEYQGFVDATGARPPEGWVHGRHPYGQDAFPVRGIDFDEAGAFARFVGGRVPRADEWEVAAHGGRTPTSFPWGDDVPDRLANAAGRLVPVAREPLDTSVLGCRDMAASVSEWVIGSDGRPAWKGGSYLSRVGYLRVTRAALRATAEQRRAAVGLRVADRAAR